jgi:hypothetical protein
VGEDESYKSFLQPKLSELFPERIGGGERMVCGEALPAKRGEWAFFRLGKG